MKMRFLMTLMFAGLCVSVPRAQGAEGHAGDSEKKVASVPVDVSAFAQEIDRLVVGELSERLGKLGEFRQISRRTFVDNSPD